jgi:hypothetical protein
VPCGRKCSRGLQKLVGHFTRDLNEEVEQEKGDVRVERAGRGRGRRRADESEEVAEEGWVLGRVRANEEEGEDVGEFVA